MTGTGTAVQGAGSRAVPWDGPAAICACICACVSAYGVYLVLPLVLGALADSFGFSNRQIGWIGSAENAGLLLGSVAVAAIARQGRYRRLVACGIGIALAGNAATLLVTAFVPLAGIRLCTGFGNGMCYSAAIACLSLSRKSARNFSVFVVILTVANSVELWLAPTVLAAGGIHGLYATLGALFVVPTLLLKFLPARIEPPDGPSTISRIMADSEEPLQPALAWTCLAAIVCFNVAASAFWAYSERIGTSIGMSDVAVANTLTLCNLFSLTGSLLAYALGRNFGQHRPQLVAVAVMIVVFATWSTGISVPGYIIGVLLFFEVWSTASVLQLSTLSGIDRSGRRVALVPAAQGIGQSAGPFLAGALLGWQLGFPQMLLSVTVFAVACLALYGTVYVKLRRIRPSLADA